MADFTISRFHVITSDGFRAAQMRIRGLGLDLACCFCGGGCWNSQIRRVEHWAPQIGTTPIIGISVIQVVFGFMLAGDRQMRVDVRAILNLLFRQRNIQPLGLPVRMEYGHWRDQHLPSAKPTTGFYREVADSPRLIVEIELINSSKLSIRSVDHETFQECSIR